MASLVLHASAFDRDKIDKAHWMLNVGNEIYRSFATIRGKDVLHAYVDAGKLCVNTYKVNYNGVARKRYEDSWTGIKNTDGKLISVYSGTCFSSAPSTCEEYRPCDTAEQMYRQEERSDGRRYWTPEEEAVKGLRFAAAAWRLQARESEEALLLTGLADQGISADSRAFLDSLALAACSAAMTDLRGSPASLAEQVSYRVDQFKASAEVVVPLGYKALPQEVRTLAEKLKALVQEVRVHTCGAETSWDTLRSAVATAVAAHDPILQNIQVQDLHQQQHFDYAVRAAESMLVGVGLVLQAAALSASLELQCSVHITAEAGLTAKVIDLETMRSTAGAALQALSMALPRPDPGSRHFQQCLAERVERAANSMTAQAAQEGKVPSLLSLDFCYWIGIRLAAEVIALEPDVSSQHGGFMTPAGAGPRNRSFHSTGRFGFVFPYAEVVRRSDSVGSNLFSAEDKVVLLEAVDDATNDVVRNHPQRVLLEDEWSVAELKMRQRADELGHPTDCDGKTPYGTYRYPLHQACDPGCFWLRAECKAAWAGYWADGTEKWIPTECTRVDWSYCTGDESLSHPAYCAHPYRIGWPNATCEMMCIQQDRTWRVYLQRCVEVGAGHYSEYYDNAVKECSFPNIASSDAVGHALVRFTSSGQGREDGCELTLSMVMTSGSLPALAPPFTVEFWVKIDAKDIPMPSVAEWPRIAIIMGHFPRWYVALWYFSDVSVKVCLYYDRMTLSVSSREASLTCSKAIPWNLKWRHVAVVVPTTATTSDNIFFYLNGDLVGSAMRQRQETSQLESTTSAELKGAYHIGPPARAAYPESGMPTTKEAYFYKQDEPTKHFNAQVDEVRVTSLSLDPLSLGAFVTEYRRNVVCDASETLTSGGLCVAPPRLAGSYVNDAGEACQAGYESCSAMPGFCVAACERSTVRQPDCSCDCPPGQFQVWWVKTIWLSGTGTIQNYTIYGEHLAVLGQSSNGGLNLYPELKIDLAQAERVVAITVRGSSSNSAAQDVSLSLTTMDGKKLPVKKLQKVPLVQGRDVVLHHERIDDLLDTSLACSRCPGGVLGSDLPRVNVLKCKCASGMGRNFLGECKPLRRDLTKPLAEPPGGEWYTAGQAVTLKVPEVNVDGDWLLTMHYTIAIGGADPPTPLCRGDMLYDAKRKMRPAGCDADAPECTVIKQAQNTTVKAVLCHPMQYPSDIATFHFWGKDQLGPPDCRPRGNLSASGNFALQADVLMEASHPNATMFYRMGGGMENALASGKSILLIAEGASLIVDDLEVYSKLQTYDDSAVTKCPTIQIDAPARLTVTCRWEPESGDLYPLGGAVSAEGGSVLLRRHVSIPGPNSGLRMRLQVARANPSSDFTIGETQIRYCLQDDCDQLVKSWKITPANGSIFLSSGDLFFWKGSRKTISMKWCVKEAGFVESPPAKGVSLLLLNDTAAPPSVEPPAVVTPWSIGDDWLPGPKKDNTETQVHRITIHSPTTQSRVYFMLGSLAFNGLLQSVVSKDIASLSEALVQNFDVVPVSPKWTPSMVQEKCVVPPVGAAKIALCQYLESFTVFGNTTVTAFALEDGVLESAGARMTVPFEKQPQIDDAQFQADVDFEGLDISISSMGGIHVLPPWSTELRFTLTKPGGTIGRKVCILLYPLVIGWTPDQNGTIKAEKARNCTWHAYDPEREPMRWPLLPASRSVRLELLTSVKKDGYLWAFPKFHHFLWFREYSSEPSFFGVGRSSNVSAIIWLAAEELEDAKVFFVLSQIPIVDEGLSSPFLMSLVQLSSIHAELGDILRETTMAREAKRVSVWGGNTKECAWDRNNQKVCEMQIVNRMGMPIQSLQSNPPLPYLCTWTVMASRFESTTKCALIDKLASGADELAKGREERTMSTSDLTGGDRVLGWDKRLGNQIMITFGIHKERRRRRLAARTITRDVAVLMDIAHPMRRLLLSAPDMPIRYRAVSQPVPVDFVLNVSTPAEEALKVISDAIDSQEWQEFSKRSVTPPKVTITLEPGKLTLMALELTVRSSHTNWEEPLRIHGLGFGEHGPLTLETHTNRSVIVRGVLAQSTVVYAWFLDESGVEVIDNPAGLLNVTSRFELCSDVTKCVPELEAVLVDVSKASIVNSCVVAANTESANGFNATRPTLCVVAPAAGASTVRLRVPDHRRWVLWAAARGPGLDLGEAAGLVLERQCKIELGASLTGEPTCDANGTAAPPEYIDPGDACEPRCKLGFVPSSRLLQCIVGGEVLMLSCEAEMPCAAPTGIQDAETPACTGLELVPSRSVCFTRCRDSYGPSVEVLTCIRGNFSPSGFTCEYIFPREFTAGLGGSALMAMVFCISGFLLRRHLTRALGVPEEEEEPDALTDWLACVNEVEPGVCVFCGRDEATEAGSEEQNGPLTTFRSCEGCAYILRDMATFGEDENSANSAARTNSEGEVSDREGFPTLMRPPIGVAAGGKAARDEETVGMSAIEPLPAVAAAPHVESTVDSRGIAGASGGRHRSRERADDDQDSEHAMLRPAPIETRKHGASRRRQNRTGDQSRERSVTNEIADERQALASNIQVAREANLDTSALSPGEGKRRHRRRSKQRDEMPAENM